MAKYTNTGITHFLTYVPDVLHRFSFKTPILVGKK